MTQRSVQPERKTLAFIAACAVVSMASCGGAPPVDVGPQIDAEQVASAATTTTAVQRPTRIMFEWNLVERDARVRGTGVARIESPERARLDLFRSNLEPFASAVVLGGDLQMRAGVDEAVIPPANLLWATLGVFRPGAGALVGGQDRGADGTMLRYLFPADEELRYRLGGLTVLGAERYRNGNVIQDVVVEYGEEFEFPAGATYRDLAEFIELRLTTTSVTYVEPYPPDVWTLGR